MNNKSILVLDVLALILFVSLADMAQNLPGFAAVKHLTLIFVLAVFAFFSLLAVYNFNKTGWNVLLFIFLLALVELFVVYFMHRIHFVGFVLLVGVGLLGFFITVVKAAEVDEVEEEVELPPLEEAPQPELNVEEIVPEHSVVYKSHQPGKFVASKTGTTYHEPKCDWAKRIKKKNMVWFGEAKAARKEGYRKPTCCDPK